MDTEKVVVMFSGFMLLGFVLAQAAGCSMEWAQPYLKEQGWLLDYVPVIVW